MCEIPRPIAGLRVEKYPSLNIRRTVVLLFYLKYQELKKFRYAEHLCNLGWISRGYDDGTFIQFLGFRCTQDILGYSIPFKLVRSLLLQFLNPKT